MDENNIEETGPQNLIDFLQRLAYLFSPTCLLQRSQPNCPNSNNSISSSIVFLAKLGVPALLSLQSTRDLTYTVRFFSLNILNWNS
jgi:hypothetical protein